MSTLLDLVDTSWAEDLGCPVELLAEPGVHLVPGGVPFKGYQAVYLAKFDKAVLVYCPLELIGRAKAVLQATSKDGVFTPTTAALIAGSDRPIVLGPSRHAFVDASHFRPAQNPSGSRLEVDDPAITELRALCGDHEWGEAGFGRTEGFLYGLNDDKRLLAVGNMAMYRGQPADVGVITAPAQRGRGLARRLVTQMIIDLLPAVGVIRYRALLANDASLVVANALGFVSRGENLVVRLNP